MNLKMMSHSELTAKLAVARQFLERVTDERDIAFWQACISRLERQIGKESTMANLSAIRFLAGHPNDDEPADCPDCHGTGYCPDCDGHDLDCQTCDGTGDCPKCDGFGFLEKEQDR